MTDQLYRWVKSTERNPESKKDIAIKHDDLGPLVGWWEEDKKKWFTDNNEAFLSTSIEWLEPYTPPPVSGSLEEAATAKLKSMEYGGSYSGDQMREMFAAGASHGKGGEEKPKEESVKMLMGLVRYGWTCALDEVLKYCNDTKVSMGFIDKIMELLNEENKQKFVFEIFQKHIPETPGPSIVDELRRSHTYGGAGEEFKNVWERCCNKLSELLNHSK